MPMIRTYTNPIDKIEPSSLGSQAWESAGYHLDRLLSQTGARIAASQTFAGGVLSKAYSTTASLMREQGASYSQEMSGSSRMISQEREDDLRSQAKEAAIRQRQQQQAAQEAAVQAQADARAVAAQQRQQIIDNQQEAQDQAEQFAQDEFNGSGSSAETGV